MRSVTGEKEAEMSLSVHMSTDRLEHEIKVLQKPKLLNLLPE
jgi:hypothetical protein